MTNFLNTPGAAPAAPTGPTAQRGPVQADGTVSPMGEKPTRAPLQTRSASPNIAGRSGMETAMGALADKMHPPRRR